MTYWLKRRRLKANQLSLAYFLFIAKNTTLKKSLASKVNKSKSKGIVTPVSSSLTKNTNQSGDLIIEEYPTNDNKFRFKVNGSKNCALAVVMYTFLIGKGNVITIKNVPPISDIVNTLEMFKAMGGIFKYQKNKNELVVFEGIKTTEIPADFISKTRASVLLMSIMLVKYGSVSFPKKVGGCNLGNRPYDYHLNAFKKLGCTVNEQDTSYVINKNKLVRDETLEFRKQTTTGTANALFLANFNSKNTLIKKAHCRPEILELIKFINKLGGNVEVKNDSILIKKTQKTIDNKKATFTIIDDLEEALSYVALGFITDSSLKIEFKNPYKYKEIETLVDLSSGSLTKEGRFLIQTPFIFSKHKFVKIRTGAYPDFGSDAQPIIAALLLKISESFRITDTRFINRFKYSEYLDEFNIKHKKTSKFIYVPSTQEKNNYPLKKTYHILTAYDLRSAMNAVLTAAVFKRKIIILDAHLILRGYANFFNVLETLNFKIIKS